MPTYRVTYAEDWSNELLRQSFSNATVLQPNASLSANGRIEVRSDEGDLFRIASGGRLYFEDTPEGRQPCVEGEMFGHVINAWPKYPTSCHNCRLHSSVPLQLLIRPSPDLKYADEYTLLSGEMIIHDFDERGRHFTICNLHEGQKALVRHNPEIKVGPQRYTAEVTEMSDEDYDYALRNYVDPRRWK